MHPEASPSQGQAGHKTLIEAPAAAGVALSLARRAATGRRLLVLTADGAEAVQLSREIAFFRGGEDVTLFPDRETLPYDSFSPHPDLVSDRLRLLANLSETPTAVVVAAVSTLMQWLPPKDYVQGQSFVLKPGQRFDINATRSQLEQAGYQSVTTVYEHGEYALRGSVVDIFPMGATAPIRIDLFDEDIDSLRLFDPDTQRSTDKIESVELLPARECPLDPGAISRFRNAWHGAFDVDHRNCPVYRDVCQGISPPGIEYFLPLFFDNPASLLDYLPADTEIAVVGEVHQAAESYWRDAKERYEQRRGDLSRPLLPPDQAFWAVDRLFGRLRDFAGLKVVAANDTPPALPVSPKEVSPLAPLQDYIEHHRVLICAESAGRREVIADMLRKHNLTPVMAESWERFTTGSEPLMLAVADFERGMQLESEGLALVCESQLYGRRVAQSRRRRKDSGESAEWVIQSLAELGIGDPVVHIDHGIGRYHGLKTLEAGGECNEFLAITYADDATLYVPVNDLHRISQYRGSGEGAVTLHRLGNEQWQKAKRRAAEKVRDVAAELLAIYAAREAKKGFAYTLEEDAYERFAAEFPFEETADQETAIDAVLEDLQRPKPMDRLICGDVGFGKTEVALRAAFVVASTGKQVAVLVPTTLLAQQHYESLSDRFADWPVQVDMLSRFRSAAEQDQTIANVAAGKVDILVGTHKLLNSSVKYRDLGLLIIDEEHRFGVRQKDALKALRANVDILTLTATPIPRTLNMAMSGMRDLSIITTPPARRLSVKTFVRPRDPALIKEAISREILRGGQVFYVYNEVKSIDRAAKFLQELMPSLHVGVAHGQMPERQLEQVMSDFYHKRHNVLLCSTIIETGIDIPNANTIIIERADNFGLAQLHQLRGRVGRSHHQAYAYLLTPEHGLMTGDADKRLNAISEASDLGAGFTLASHDLEIRGAGELLGDEQSGQIEGVGFTLYMDMLDRAVAAIKRGETPVDAKLTGSTTAEVNLRIPALIPDDYVPDVHLRLTLYKRIADALNEDALETLQVEMIDRFGLLPDPLKNLMRVAMIKQELDVLGIAKLDMSSVGGKLEFNEQTAVDPFKLVTLVQQAPDVWRMDGATRLRFRVETDTAAERLEFVDTLIHTLA